MTRSMINIHRHTKPADAGEPQERDPGSGALHLVHAAARLLMAAACVEREKAGGK